jgi:hypothetical protein
MVQMTVEQAMAYKRGNARDGDGELSNFDRDIIGPPVRLEIPVDNVYNLRAYGQLLRALGDELEGLSTNSRGLDDRQLLVLAKQAAREAQAKIRAVTQRPKVPKPYQRRNPLPD